MNGIEKKIDIAKIQDLTIKLLSKADLHQM